MAVKIGEAIVSLGKYTGKDGKERAKTKSIGAVMRHSDGRMYIMADRYFNLAALPAKEGADIIFIGLNISDTKATAADREPGQEG